MKTLSLLMSTILTACAVNATEPDGGVGRDVGEGRDAGVAIEDVRVRDAGTARGHEPQMQIIDSRPCEAWDPVNSQLPRGLPSDPTPRVLWTYQPAEDPRYDARDAHFQTRVGRPVLSPDGTIWVHGPGYDQISQLNRNGTMRRWFTVGGADDTDEFSHRLGDISMAPNGHALAVIFDFDPEGRGFIASIDPETSLRTTSNAPLELDFGSRLAISPDGMVYAISQNRVYGLCRGERHMWTLTILSAGGERDFFQTGHFGWVFVQPDGSLVLSGNFANTYTVRGTEVSSELLLDFVGGSVYRAIMAVSPDRLVVQAYDPAREPGGRFDVGVRVGSNDWRRETTTNDRFAMNALGELHLFDSDGASYRWDPVDDVRTLLTDTSFYGQTAWLVDGGWLSVVQPWVPSFPDSIDADGNVRWSLEPEPGEERGWATGPQEYVLDDQAVYYHVSIVDGSYQLTAVQTDVLPAPNTMCLDYFGCNPHRDRYLRPE